MTNTDYEKAFGATDVTSEAMQTARQNWLQLYYNTAATQTADPCQRIAYTVVQKLVRSVFAEYGASCQSGFYQAVLKGLDNIRSLAVQQALILPLYHGRIFWSLAETRPVNLPMWARWKHPQTASGIMRFWSGDG